jgi:hypothetical protein
MDDDAIKAFQIDFRDEPEMQQARYDVCIRLKLCLDCGLDVCECEHPNFTTLDVRQ